MSIRLQQIARSVQNAEKLPYTINCCCRRWFSSSSVGFVCIALYLEYYFVCIILQHIVWLWQSFRVSHGRERQDRKSEWASKRGRRRAREIERQRVEEIRQQRRKNETIAHRNLKPNRVQFITRTDYASAFKSSMFLLLLCSSSSSSISAVHF